ncbi:hypothetical protein C7437_101516 [Psychrobacillus insolitus]|uniref:Uncharacterized protein n=1 Tax=Psychrobacillus insolitus TaxID=1461 RepID=A0A2W7N612_9BACI|nr:hypothetical protein [Psychrobacillus insolitus]PZX07403.1 hypothetical protein C7437_101516 [Psychrobacillus insolitus]
MKLVLCLHCQDLFNLALEEKSCRCGLTKGKYINQLHAIYSGEHAMPLGFANSSLIKAIQNQPKEGLGETFTAFIIPRECATFVKED